MWSNGIGKTSILNAIAAVFVHGESRIKKRAQTEGGFISATVNVESVETKAQIDVNNFEMQRGFIGGQALIYQHKAVILVKSSRDFGYKRLETITTDPDSTIVNTNALNFGINSSDIKQWFANRYLLSPHAESSWTPAMISNFNTAKRIFSVLDQSVTLKAVNSRTFDVEVSTPSGLLPFELLSSGFRTIYSLFLGIIKEIEHRALDVSAEEFSGIILIDEIELHLHPSWQQKVGESLKNIFPKAQIICTTHSPHVIQFAAASEVMPLTRLADERVEVRDLNVGKFGFEGWTIEEILEEVMGMSDTMTPLFRARLSEFDRAVDAGDSAVINSAGCDLLKMLHPRNPLRKLIQIELAVTPE